MFKNRKTRLKSFALIIVLGFSLLPLGVSAGFGCRADERDLFSPVVRIVSPSTTCSGIAVNPYQIITAAHCLVKGNMDIKIDQLKIHMRVSGAHTILDAQNFHVHKMYKKYGKFDIAIIDLKDSSESFFRIGNSVLSEGDKVEVGGYGVQSISGYGPASTIRKMGKNYVELVDDYYLNLSPVIIPASTKTASSNSQCIIFFGDSGGGLIKDKKVYGIQGIGTRVWERDGTIIHQDRVLRLDALGVKGFLLEYLDANSWES
jgi:hypothetical protein